MKHAIRLLTNETIALQHQIKLTKIFDKDEIELFKQQLIETEQALTHLQNKKK